MVQGPFESQLYGWNNLICLFPKFQVSVPKGYKVTYHNSDFTTVTDGTKATFDQSLRKGNLETTKLRFWFLWMPLNVLDPNTYNHF